MPFRVKLGDLVKPSIAMQVVSGYPEEFPSLWAGKPGLVVKVSNDSVDVLSCDGCHRHVKLGFIELFDDSNNN